MLPIIFAATPAAEIAAFNAALSDATKKMDNAASLALWEEDGVTLMPGRDAIVGKKEIARFFDEATKGSAGAKMVTFGLQCYDIRVEARTASEWCTNLQVVQLRDNKKIEAHGKLLLVLHKGDDGKWRLQKEMWNP